MKFCILLKDWSKNCNHIHLTFAKMMNIKVEKRFLNKICENLALKSKIKFLILTFSRIRMTLKKVCGN